MRLNSSTNGEHRRFPPRQCALNRHAQQALPSFSGHKMCLFHPLYFLPRHPYQWSSPSPHPDYRINGISVQIPITPARIPVRTPKGFPNIKKALPKSQEGFAQSIAGWSTTRPSANERGTSMIRWLRDPRNRMIKDFWMPNRAWEGCNVDDPSARALKNYGASGF